MSFYQKDKKLDITVDFDGTCVSYAYPKVGEEIGAIPVLKSLTDNGHHLILYTMRSGKELQDAIDWFLTNSIPLYAIQFNPTQHKWTTSNKCYAHLYIDDAALGCPLLFPENQRPHVDWIAIKKLLEDRGII